MFTHAIVRKPGANFAQGITTSQLGQPDLNLMQRQHQAYTEVLKSLGLEVVVLEVEPKYPDAYFVEDVAVITPQIAIITNPGAAARNGEQESIEPVLRIFRPITHIQAPGTVDGGDVLMTDQHFFVGISERTNLEGAKQLGNILTEFGYTWTPIEVAAGLHLKSSINYVGGGTLLISDTFANLKAFGDYQKIVVPRDEAYAANTLWVNDQLLMPGGFPKTRQLLADTGLPIHELDVSEAQKMDGGLTCMSLRLQEKESSVRQE